MRIRDPIHGTLLLSDEERAVVDSPHFQRLRQLRQLGFGEMAFPGATHTRHGHSLGAMHLAGRLFHTVAEVAGLPPDVRDHFSRAVRLAVLCHDLGHMPLSHSSERIAPQRSTLALPAWLGESGDAQASHEDYTARIVLDSSLTPLLEARFGPLGLTPAAVVALIAGATPPEGLRFTHAGRDWTPLLRSLVSGELDADRMDYLLRDSFYTGVNYGRYDLDWIVSNLRPVAVGDRVHLGLTRPGVFAFEDFLLSRQHMFLAVYLHHTSVNFDHMLMCFNQEAAGEFTIPSDPEAFLHCDDVALHAALRASKNRWAQWIATRRPFKRIVQLTNRDDISSLQPLREALDGAGVEFFQVENEVQLSKYAREGINLFVVDDRTGDAVEVGDYTPLYERFAGAVRLVRIFARPDQGALARELVARHLPGNPREDAAHLLRADTPSRNRS